MYVVRGERRQEKGTSRRPGTLDILRSICIYPHNPPGPLITPNTYTYTYTNTHRDPVVAKDGHTYERSAITTWLETHKASPMVRNLPID